MLYCLANQKYPLNYLSCGNLISEGDFLHTRRTLDHFVFIIVCKGTLHITQNEKKYSISENESIVLFPHQLHYGHKASDGPLSYYWVHFTMTDPDYRIYSRRPLLQHQMYHPGGPDADSETEEDFILPEYSHLSSEKRSMLLFHQLLDIAKRENCKCTWRCHYALSLLLSEFTAEISISHAFTPPEEIPGNVKDIIEWIRIHYDRPLTVNQIAQEFNYNPTYLTSLIKKYTGQSVSGYLNNIRIDAAKNLLCVNYKTRLTQIAQLCGFSDEKYFMRLFKRMEGMTPSQYRNAFHEKTLNLN